MHWNFEKDRLYFVLDPEGDGITYFETIEERDAFAAESVKQYIDPAWNEWDENVEYVVAGIVTHRAQQVDRIDRPDALDEEDCDGEGRYWPPDCLYKCGYKLLPAGD